MAQKDFIQNLKIPIFQPFFKHLLYGHNHFQHPHQNASSFHGTNGFLFRLLHLWVTFVSLILRGTWGRNDSCINNRATLDNQACLVESTFDVIKNLLAYFVVFHEMAKVEERSRRGFCIILCS